MENGEIEVIPEKFETKFVLDRNDDPKPVKAFQTDEEAMTRNAIRSDGTFARREFWVVANDLTEMTYKSDSDIDAIEAEVRKVTGDTLFSGGRVADSTFHRNLDSAVNSARGYMSRYCHTKHGWRDRCCIRGNIQTEWTKADRPKSDNLEAGGYIPVRVKVIALPPKDEIADECSSYSEYAMKCKLRGVEPKMAEREFIVYKY